MAKANEEKVNLSQTEKMGSGQSGTPVPTEKDTKEKKSMAELIAAEKKRMEEYVTFEAFKGEGKYADDVFLSVNGETCRIQRGVPVKIKRKFALEYERSYKGDQRTAAKIALLAASANTEK